MLVASLREFERHETAQECVLRSCCLHVLLQKQGPVTAYAVTLGAAPYQVSVGRTQPVLYHCVEHVTGFLPYIDLEIQRKTAESCIRHAVLAVSFYELQSLEVVPPNVVLR